MYKITSTSLASILFTFIVGFSLSTPLFSAPVNIDTSGLDREESNKPTLSLGTSRSVAKSAFVGVGNQSTGLPYISFNYKRFYIEGVAAGLRLHSKDALSFSLVATPRYYEVKESFAPEELAGIEETKPTYFAGLSTRYQLEPVNIGLQILSDVGNQSDGIEIVASLDQAYQFNKLTLLPAFNVNWRDDKVVDHFYGVQASEVNAALNRPLYEGESTLSYQFSLSAIYDIHSKVRLLAAAKQDIFGQEIKDSPIVSESSISSFAIGITYKLL